MWMSVAEDSWLLVFRIPTTASHHVSSGRTSNLLQWWDGTAGRRKTQRPTRKTEIPHKDSSVNHMNPPSYLYSIPCPTKILYIFFKFARNNSHRLVLRRLNNSVVNASIKYIHYVVIPGED